MRGYDPIRMRIPCKCLVFSWPWIQVQRRWQWWQQQHVQHYTRLTPLYLTHLRNKISITFFPALHIITELNILYTILYCRCSNTQRQCEIRWKILTTYSLPPSMIATEPVTTAYCDMQHDLNPSAPKTKSKLYIISVIIRIGCL